MTSIGLEAMKPRKDPGWLDRPALSRITVSSPEILRLFGPWSAGEEYAGQVKPANFLLAAQVVPFGHPPGVDPARFLLVAPYSSDPREWGALPWRNRFDTRGPTYRIDTGDPSIWRGEGVVVVKSYCDVLAGYLAHFEAKAAGPDGRPSGPATRGLLGRRSVRAATVSYVGKESNRLHEVGLGLVHDPDEVYVTYRRPGEDDWELFRRVLALVPLASLRAESGLSASALKAIRQGSERPRDRNRRRLENIAVRRARAALGSAAPGQAIGCLAAFLEQAAAEEPRCSVCGGPLPSRRATYCGGRCRQRALRSRREAVSEPSRGRRRTMGSGH
jgi:hypothetical protein